MFSLQGFLNSSIKISNMQILHLIIAHAHVHDYEMYLEFKNKNKFILKINLLF